MAELTPYQRDILIRTALGEARGEGPDGMADVVQVILNRARSPKFPDDPAEVALQNKQFSTWNKGAGGNNPQQFSPNSKAYQTAADVVDLVASGRAPDMTGGALDYHASNVSPYWADSKKGQYGTIERNGHTFYPTHPVPPGELPSVASLLSVYREAPNPVTSSPDLAQMRRTSAPSRLIQDSFAQLPQRPGSKLADNLAMSPIQGGRQTAQPFDAAFDTRTGNMRMLAQPEAVSSQGLGVGTSRAPAPIPAQPSPQLAGRRATDPVLQTALNSRFPTPLPPIPPSTLGQAPSTRVVHSVPVTPPTPPKPLPRVTVTTPYNLQQHLVGQDAGNVPRALPAPTQTAFVPEARYIEPRNVPAPSYAGPFVPDKGLERLASPAGLPVADTQLARLLAPIPAIRPAMFAQSAPAPMPPYNDVGTDLAIRPMPSLPRVRPSFIQQRPVVAQQRAPLRITVQGAQVRRPVAAQPLPAAPALSKAQLYALLTANRSGSNSDAANRVNGSNTRGSGGARSLLD